MHITIIAHEFSPFMEKSPLSKELVHLARALRKQGHRVTVLMPFSETIDIGRYSLARRLMPVKAAVDDGQLVCHRYDGRTSDGVEVLFLDITGAKERPTGSDDARLFNAGVCEVAAGFSERPDGCVAVGGETAALAEMVNSDDRLAELPIISMMTKLDDDTDESVVRALEAADRIVLCSNRLYAGTLSERLRPLKEKLSKGHIHWMATPGVQPSTPLDKASAKAAAQVKAGLPVRGDVPLVVFAEGAADALTDFLTRDVQAMTPAGLEGISTLSERYPDRLAVFDGPIAGPLAGADGCVSGGNRSLAATAMLHSAVPIVAAELAGEAVDLETDLGSGSAIVVSSLEAPPLVAGLERLITAFHLGESFTRLLARLPTYACTWEKATSQLNELITEIALEKKRDEQEE